MSSNEVTWKDKLKAYTRTPGSLIVMLLVMLSAIMTFAVLIFLIVYVLAHGVPYLKPSIFSLHYTSENASLMPALINTVIMTLLSLLIAVPFGIFLFFLFLNGISKLTDRLSERQICSV